MTRERARLERPLFFRLENTPVRHAIPATSRFPADAGGRRLIFISLYRNGI
jgi:hypothetical protein